MRGTEIVEALMQAPLVEVARHRLEPQDVIVVRVRPEVFSEHDLELLREAIAYVFPGHRALVIDDNVEVNVARPEDGDV